MTTLVIVESPGKIKKIQEMLGDDYKVMASFGHIRDLAKGGNHGIGIDITKDFKPHYILLADKMQVINNIINEASKSDEILLATDFDREGEMISYDLDFILKTTGKSIHRITFGEITKSAITNAIKNKRTIDMNMVRAQNARRILDRIVGFTVSPFLMQSYNQNTLSAGRVQSVATRLITDREKEISDFKSEEYWVLQLKLSTKQNEQFIVKYDNKLKNEEETKKLVQTIEQDGNFIVQKVQKQDKKEKPPAPLITASLQQIMAKQGFEPDRTMKAAQGLYELGYITYMRTDAVRASDEAIVAVRQYLKDNNIPIPKSKNIYEAKDTAQAAHECIRPTHIDTTVDKVYLSADEKSVYEAIWQFFVASQMEPATWNTLNVKIALKSSPKCVFKATGKALADEGFLQIFGGVEPGKIEIPNLTNGEELRLVKNSIKPEQKFTQPPPRYNDASLLKELESRQVGRPATFAEIVKKISNRNYVEKQGSTYRPTELGREITNNLSKLFTFMRIDFTASIEEELDRIAEGKITHLDLLNKFYGIFGDELANAYKGAFENKHTCEKCDKVMLEKTGKYGKFLACTNPACKFLKNMERVA